MSTTPWTSTELNTVLNGSERRDTINGHRCQQLKIGTNGRYFSTAMYICQMVSSMYVVINNQRQFRYRRQRLFGDSARRGLEKQAQS